MDHFAKFLSWAQREGVNRLQLTPVTGEAFLDPKLIEKLEFATQRGFDCFLFTNGSRIHEVNLDRLLACRIDELSISLGGFDREAYRESFGVDMYETVLANTESLLSKVSDRHREGYPVPKIILCVRSVRRLSDEIACPDYAIKLKRFVDAGLATIDYLNIYDSFDGWIVELPGKMRVNSALEMSWLKRTLPCWYLSVIGLSSNGDVRLCNCIMSESVHGSSELIIGTIHDDLRQILKNAEMKFQLWKSGRIPRSCLACRNYCI